ncbi:MAG: Fic family protein [Cyanobacteriota bacterium]
MKRSLQGYYIPISTVGEKAKAFVPSELPPIPDIIWSPELRSKFDEALLSLGRLDGITNFLPDTSLFLYMYVRKEAVLSSMIEGTQSSLSDLLIFELEEQPNVPLDDVQEVSNYVRALNYGLKRLEEGFPLSLRLIKEIHAVLMSKGRGSKQNPGEFRKSQNWIGGTRPGNAFFVPPPPELVLECMGKLELFIHDQPIATPILLKTALTHVQFETIHPFLDGNGRLGRLLITLLLCEQKVLSSPMLYLSLYFKTHRQYYYELLNNIRNTGDWESWLDFFAEAVIVTSEQAVNTAKLLLDLSKDSQNKINELGRQSVSCQKIHQILLERPIATSKWISEKTGISPATVNKNLEQLKLLGIIKEITSQKRNKIFSYSKYIEIMDKGTDLL